MRAPLCFLLASSAAGCTPFVLVPNGGVPLAPGSCDDVALVGDLEIVQASAPGCDGRPGQLVPSHAAAAFWQLASPSWNGPIIAPPAQVELEVPAEAQASLASGTRDAGLSGGTRDKALVSGTRDAGLSGGTRDAGLSGGTRDKALASGTRDAGLSGGTRDKALVSGTRETALDGGTRDKAFDGGARERVPLTLDKSGRGRATVDKAARFVLTVTNVSDVPVQRVAVVDRVDGRLRVEADGAKVSSLPDGTTLVIFRSDEPLAPHATRSFDLKAFARGAVGAGVKGGTR